MAKINEKNPFPAEPGWVFGGEWSSTEAEGKLAVDVAENDAAVFVVATVAGAHLDSIEVFAHNDIVTIRGRRNVPALPSTDLEFIHQECFWGPFSRTIVLPSEVKAEQARAEYKNGVLTILIPKRKVDTKIAVKIIEE
jgi:HSP20 family protein